MKIHKTLVAVGMAAGLILAGLLQPASAQCCPSGSKPAGKVSATGAASPADCAVKSPCATPSSAAAGAAQPTGSMTVVQMAASLPSCRTFVEAVQAAKLTDALSAEGPFTLFIPSDEAFARIPRAQMQALLEDPQKLTAVLMQHVVAGRMSSADMAAPHPVKALGGATIDVGARGEELLVNGARVLAADHLGHNGVVHVIDRVMLPGAAS
ncbi:MAG: fasciclin domain-containing protein [Candidatus Eisenbacteria bacterium]|uniref:Fasciclin domain-containing protein n=1 Tax=Eiseniibacteriota bacterium TaxID=2212470 RepID=A0A938BPX2_UNCEI|nr:fasciclin domain-containing protein [Candidatus Eisenbacteria bacterium]